MKTHILFVLLLATATLLFAPVIAQAQAGCCETDGGCTRVNTEDECKEEAGDARYYFAETGFCADGKCQASSENPTQVEPWEQPVQPIQPTAVAIAVALDDPKEDPAAAGCCQTSESTCVQTDDIEACGKDNWLQLATCDKGLCQGTAADPTRLTTVDGSLLQPESCASIFR